MPLGHYIPGKCILHTFGMSASLATTNLLGERYVIPSHGQFLSIVCLFSVKSHLSLLQRAQSSQEMSPYKFFFFQISTLALFFLSFPCLSTCFTDTEVEGEWHWRDKSSHAKLCKSISPISSISIYQPASLLFIFCHLLLLHW